MTEIDGYHPADAAKIAKAEADLKRHREAAAELDRMLAAAKMVAKPSIGNRYRYHRTVDRYSPFSAAVMAVLGLMLFRP